jgi:hypothetical protein
MGSVNNLNPKMDQTVKIFDEFYEFAVDVDANEYDAVSSFFESVFTSKTAALNFTTVLFRIADQTQTPVLTLLDEIQGQDEIELNQTLAYYLNGLRSPTTLLGITEPVVPNYWTARNVLP